MWLRKGAGGAPPARAWRAPADHVGPPHVDDMVRLVDVFQAVLADVLASHGRKSPWLLSLLGEGEWANMLTHWAHSDLQRLHALLAARERPRGRAAGIATA
eukprot:jgi/Mesvir1/5337/Mv15426-RA.1